MNCLRFEVRNQIVKSIKINPKDYVQSTKRGVVVEWFQSYNPWMWKIVSCNAALLCKALMSSAPTVLTNEESCPFQPPTVPLLTVGGV